jgi:hypothetical protein
MDNVGPIGGLFVWVIWLITLAFTVFEIIMIIDVIKNKKLNNTAKVLWTIGILVLSPIASVVYFFVAHTKRH